MQTLYGKLNNPIIPANYTGGSTLTAQTLVDSNTLQVLVNVLRTPGTLTIMTDDVAYKFNGSVGTTIDLKPIYRTLESKQDTLTAGENITIENNVISADFTDTTVDVQIDGTSITDDLVANIRTINSNYEAISNPLATKNDLDQLSNDIEQELNNQQEEIGTLQTDVGLAQTNISTLQTDMGLAQTNISTLQTDVDDIKTLIPTEATSSNQLADKEFVNTGISTNSANFIGTFENVVSLESYTGVVTNNDYAWVLNSVVENNGSDWASFSDLDAYSKTLLTNYDYAWVVNGNNFDLYRFDIVNQTWVLRVSNTEKASITLNSAYNRYKAYVSNNTTNWVYEFTLNNSSFTAEQWAAITSGITSTLVTQISTNASDIANKMDKTNPTGTGSFSLNRKANTTVGDYSVAEGYNCEVSGNYSHAEGVGTTASGVASHAEGNSTVASGKQSHAEGNTNAASGDYSHAEGRYSIARGKNAHAEGSNGLAYGDYSHAQGSGTIAQRRAQHAMGQYNIADTTGADETVEGEFVEIVGNGTGPSARSNARTLDWNGNEWLAGKIIPVNGISDGNNATYKLNIPNTTSWTANKTIATLDDIDDAIGDIETLLTALNSGSGV